MATQCMQLLYKRIISPLLHSWAGPAFGCRYFPTCSAYAAEAFRTQSVLRASFKTMSRLLRCNPLFNGGFDPVR